MTLFILASECRRCHSLTGGLTAFPVTFTALIRISADRSARWC